MLKALQIQRVSSTYFELIKRLYINLEAIIITDVTGEYFKIEKGVKQGDPLSPKLFNSSLEQIFKNLN